LIKKYHFLISLRSTLVLSSRLIVFIDFCSSFVHPDRIVESGEFEMQTGLDLLLMMFAVGGAWLAAVFAAMSYFRPRQTPQLLTAQAAAQLLRAETCGSDPDHVLGGMPRGFARFIATAPSRSEGATKPAEAAVRAT
jgi:hypothetical protein